MAGWPVVERENVFHFEHRGRAFALELHPGNEQMAVHARKEGGFFEHEMLDYLADHYPVQNVILDIGANVGNHSLFFCSFLQCSHVFSFEPHPKNFALLVRNVGDLANCLPIRMGLSNRTGEAFVTTDCYNMGMCVTTDDPQKHQVSLGTVDALCLADISLMKIDTEGTELDILDGARETLKRSRPLVVLEIATANRDHYNAYMAANGYVLERYWQDKIVGLYRPIERTL
jgi:FkbM family methyltransferase